MLFRRLICNLARRLSEMPLWQLIAWMWLFALLQNGLWVRPNIDSLQHMASDPYHNMVLDIPARQYLYTSYLGVLIAHYLNAYHTVLSFAGLHVAELLIGWTAVVYLLRKKVGEAPARLATVFFIIAPISNILLTWLGVGDNLMVILSSLLVLLPGPGWTFALAFLLGLAHTEQAGVMAGMMLLGMLSGVSCLQAGNRRKTIVRGLLLSLGVLFAHVLLQTLFSRNQFNLQETRFSFFWNRSTADFLGKFFRDPTATFFSLYLIAWMPVLILLRHWWNNQRSKAWWLLMVHAMALVITMLVYDVTRVFAILSWPIIFIALVECGKEGTLGKYSNRLYRWAVVCVILSFVVPKIVVWDGMVHTGVRMHSILLALGKIDTNQEGWRMMPFR